MMPLKSSPDFSGLGEKKKGGRGKRQRQREGGREEERTGQTALQKTQARYLPGYLASLALGPIVK